MGGQGNRFKLMLLTGTGKCKRKLKKKHGCEDLSGKWKLKAENLSKNEEADSQKSKEKRMAKRMLKNLVLEVWRGRTW